MASLDFAISSTQTRLLQLRTLMAEQALDGYLVLAADEHLNEYLPQVKQRRTWLSGFTGSSGDFLVGTGKSWLFVDSRYYEQADLEVDADWVAVSKLEREGHKTMVETLEILALEAGRFRLGFDPHTLAIDTYRSLLKRLRPVRVELVACEGNLVDQVRLECGETVIVPTETPIFTVPVARTGQSVPDKLAAVREAMVKANAEVLPITKLDQVAWLFNLRGWDVPYNPVFIAYAIVTTDAAYLFTALERVDAQIREALAEVTVLPYAEYAQTLQSLSSEQARVLIDIQRTTVGTFRLLGKACVVEVQSPVEKLKAHKNATELAQMQLANLKASRAKVRTLQWLDERLQAGVRLSELDVARKVEGFYQEELDCQGLSFNTIAAAGANTSIVHYGTPSAEVFLESGSLLLLDSGAQYLGGTTDDTRTVSIGVPTAEQILHYTEVLKAHINCALQRFPQGTTGAQLDGITRSSLWLAGLDYGHGTGHGVGAFLNVHEGPAGLNKRALEPLVPGMVTSIEPGYYRPGWGGIRIENLYIVREIEAGPTPWYGFEPLTYIPFDRRLIDPSRLEPRQQQWLAHYYRVLLTKLVPLLDSVEEHWLRAACNLAS